MKSDAAEQQQVREYLFGRLAAQQQAQFEERLLIDNELYEELLIAEDELVDEYLRDELAPHDRASFESHFIASAEHQEKVRFARALKKYVGAKSSSNVPAHPAGMETPPDARGAETSNTHDGDRRFRLFGFLPVQKPVLGYALTAAVVLIVVGAGWWATRSFWTPREPGKVLSVVLSPGLTRGDGQEVNRFVINSGVDTVRLQLLLPDNRYETYQATLIDSAGRTVVNKDNLKPQTVNGQPAVVFDVETAVVPPGDYRVKVVGTDPNGNLQTVASYSFRVHN